MQVREEKVVGVPHTPVRWGALLSGFVVLTAVGWLLTMLGAALGFTIADASDAEAVTAGFGVGTALWFALSWIAAYFVGALVAARLTGSGQRDVGLLHGLTLWGLGSTVSVLFGIGLLGDDGTTVYANSSDGGMGLAPVAVALVSDGDLPELSLSDVDVPPAVTKASQRIAATVKRQAVTTLAANTEMNEQEARETIDGLDAATLEKVARALIDGDVERAQDIVAVNTSLDEADIEAAVAAAEREARQQIDAVKAEVTQAAETASTYATSVMWAIFVACAAALAASLGGGVLGAQTTERLVVVQSTTTAA